MELRDFADRILLSPSLEDKLEHPGPVLTDRDPGSVCRPAAPARPENLQFAPRRSAPQMPKPAAFRDPSRRAVAHHIMANHELQALEVMALVLRAFPEAPTEFRLGLAQIMTDEQRHTRMHVERARTLGLEFGALPVNCYIWKKSLEFRSVLDYLAGLPLTFEGRNLDHTLEFEASFEQAGDPRSAAMMAVIHKDEIEHVRFGLEWMRRLKPAGQSDWEAYASHLTWPLHPRKSIGDQLHVAPRLAAGMTDEFIRQLEECRVDDGA